MSYIAQADVEHYLGVALTPAGIATFNLLLPLLQDLIDQYCNRSWTETNPVTETFDALSAVGAGVVSNYQFFVSNPNISKTVFDATHPLAAGIHSVTIGTSPLDMNYVVSYGTFFKLAASFPSVFMANPLGFKMVTVVYDTDAVGAPKPVQLANIMWMARMIQEAPDAGKATNKVQTGTVIAQYIDEKLDMPRFVKAVLDNYRLIPLDHF